jgi:hypothetical protein
MDSTTEINAHGRHVLVQNVPAVGVQEDLLALFSAHGHVEEYVCPPSLSFAANQAG